MGQYSEDQIANIVPDQDIKNIFDPVADSPTKDNGWMRGELESEQDQPQVPLNKPTALLPG
jgi:hypothetical protein